jgi:hypothetical protein
MTIFEHMKAIDGMLSDSQEDKGTRYYQMLSGSEVNMAGMGAMGFNQSNMHGNIRVDAFGNVYQGDSPFPIGRVDPSGAGGLMQSDTFGNLTVGNSPFSIGRIDPEDHTASGVLHSDQFGHVYQGNSPFSCGDIHDFSS